jgi:hypothetical protein
VHVFFVNAVAAGTVAGDWDDDDDDDDANDDVFGSNRLAAGSLLDYAVRHTVHDTPPSPACSSIPC